MELLHVTSWLLAMTAFFPKCAEGLGTWSYHGQENPGTWKDHYSDCGGRKQSPVNIVPKETIFDAGLADLTINYEPNVSAFLQNNGHSVQASFLTGKSNISGGGLPSSRFQAVQLHFHWGSVNSRGSEHQIGGRNYPMEIHIVHYNAEKYPNASTAMKKADGLAVLGIFVEVQASDNPVLNVIVDKLEKIRFQTDNVTLDSLQPYLFLPHDITQFYTYKGSLTTPGCYETVQWFVFNHTFGISEVQLKKFRSSIFEGKRQDTKNSPLSDDFRPVQPLNGRTVTRSFKRPPFPCGKTSNTTMDCLGFADDKAVFYEATVDMCKLPAIVTLQVSQPDTDFQFTKTYFSDLPPKKIGNLDYGFSLEMHSHTSMKDQGYLHVSISQVHPLSSKQRQNLVSEDFIEDTCQLGKCIVRSCYRHWCDGTAIGYHNDSLYIGFSSTFRDLTATSPSVDVNFYRNQSGSWHKTATETFANNQEKRVHLMGTFVGSTSSARHRRMAVESSKWEYVTFKAKISKTSEKVFYQLYMTPGNGLYYKVIKDEYTLDCVKHQPTAKRLSKGTKIAIGASVISMVVALVGLTMGIIYCRRKEYSGHKPTLMDDIDAQDDYRL